MAEKLKEVVPFEFPPEFADCIAQATNRWSSLEYYVNSSIWALAGTAPALGACLTSQIVSLPARLNALLALLKLRQAPRELITLVNKLAEEVRGPTEMRNRIIHDMWMIDDSDKKRMGQLEIQAPKKLKFEIKVRPIDELKADLTTITDCVQKFWGMYQQIEAAIPALPEIPHEELHPIKPVPLGPQNPATGGQ